MLLEGANGFYFWFSVQKYRLYLRRLSGVSQQQSNLNNSFMSPQESAFGATSINGIDLQTLSASGQLSAQSLARLQAAGLGGSTAKAGMPMPLVEQKNLFSFENSKLRFGEGQMQHLSSSSKPMNLLHGIPTNMEPKQFANLHQSTQSLGKLNMRVNASAAQRSPLLMQMAQSQPRGQNQMLNENNTNSHVTRFSSSSVQTIGPNGISNGVLGNGIADTSNITPAYNPVPQRTPLLSFPMNQTNEMSVSSFPLRSTPGISGIGTKGMFHEEGTLGIKGSVGFVPSNDIFNELHQKSHDWDLTNTGLTYDASQRANPLQGNSIDVSPSVLGHQGFSSIQQAAQNKDATLIGQALISIGEGMSQGNLQNVGQHLNTLLVNNSVRVKTESIPDPSNEIHLFPEQFGQEDLMSALLKQVGSSFLSVDPKYLCFLIVLLYKQFNFLSCISGSMKALDRLKMSLILMGTPLTTFRCRTDPVNSLSNCSRQCK